MSTVKMNPKVKISQILEKKKREDPIGLITAQNDGTLAQFLADDLRAAGINPASVVFGNNSPSNSLRSSLASRPSLSQSNSLDNSPLSRQSAPLSPAQSDTLLPEPTPVIAKSPNNYTAIKQIAPRPQPEITQLPLPSCGICSLEVSKTDEFLFNGESWHKSCFTCGGAGKRGCGRTLTKDGYEVMEPGSNEPFCTQCFLKLQRSGRPSVFEMAKSRDSNPDDSKLIANNALNSKANNSNSYEYQAPSASKPSAADKFRVPIGGGGNKCELCAKTVYKMEEVFALNSTWHKHCFTCGGSGEGGCKRVLTLDKFEQHNKQPYCLSCFSKAVKSKMAQGTIIETASSMNSSAASAPVPINEPVSEMPVASPEPAPVLEIAAPPVPAPSYEYASYQNDTKKPSIASKFKAGGGGNKCPLCSKTVYKMEEVFALNSTWHKHCFTCGGVGEGGCKRVLTLDKFEQHNKQPFCSSCFSKAVKSKMAQGTIINPSLSSTSVDKSQSNDGQPYSDKALEQPTQFVDSEPIAVPETAPVLAPAPISKYDYSTSTMGGNVINRPNAAAAKFGASATASNKCPCCAKTVYKMEEIFAVNNTWHQSCFTCGSTTDQGCRRRLNQSDYEVRNGAPFCKACRARLVQADIQKATITPSPRSSELAPPEATQQTTTVILATLEPTPVPTPAPAPLLAAPAADFSAMEYSSMGGNLINRPNAAAAKFGASVSASNKCPCCTKTVYKMEEIFAVNNTWHQSCFTCGSTTDQGCRRRLNQSDYEVRNGAPFCKACRAKLAKADIEKSAPPATQPTSAKTQVSAAVTEVETNFSETATSAVDNDPGYEPTVGQSEALLQPSDGLRHNFARDPVPNTLVEAEPNVEPTVESIRQNELLEPCSAKEQLEPASILDISSKGSLYLSELSKCFCCKYDVGTIDEVIVKGESWHKNCFRCGSGSHLGCQRILSDTTYVEDNGNYFCSECHNIHNQPVADADPADELIVFDLAYEISPDMVLDDSLAPEGTQATHATNLVDTVQSELRNDNFDSLTEQQHDDSGAQVTETNDDPAGQIIDEENGVTFTDVEFDGKVYRGYHLSYMFDFDENGALYWIGTRSRTRPWENPHVAGLITATMSSTFKGSASNLAERTIEKAPTYSDNALNSWAKIDLGPNRLLLADNYTIRHGGASKGNALRNWTLQAKAHEDINDDGWVILREHFDDQGLSPEPNSSCTWELDIPEEISDSSTIGFRYFRLVQHGPNSNNNNCLFCCGLEFYGVLFEQL